VASWLKCLGQSSLTPSTFSRFPSGCRGDFGQLLTSGHHVRMLLLPTMASGCSVGKCILAGLHLDLMHLPYLGALMHGTSNTHDLC
jgi:hypothetical protein